MRKPEIEIVCSLEATAATTAPNSATSNRIGHCLAPVFFDEWIARVSSEFFRRHSKNGPLLKRGRLRCRRRCRLWIRAALDLLEFCLSHSDGFRRRECRRRRNFDRFITRARESI